MKFNSLLPELYVSDFDKSLSFYKEVLGFKVGYTRENPKFAFLSYQRTQLMIQQEDNEEDWRNGKPEYPYGRGINFQIETTDINTLVSSLQKNKYPIKRGIEKASYKTANKTLNLKEFLVMDPDGYLLRFSQEIKSSLL